MTTGNYYEALPYNGEACDLTIINCHFLARHGFSIKAFFDESGKTRAIQVHMKELVIDDVSGTPVNHGNLLPLPDHIISDACATNGKK